MLKGNEDFPKQTSFYGPIIKTNPVGVILGLFAFNPISVLLFLEEILHHLLSMKPYETWNVLHINWLAGFLNHQQYEQHLCL